MNMATKLLQNDSSNNDYTYVDEDEINPDLKCIICHQPLMKPFCGKQYGHTFCSKCINKWLKKYSSCPSCRKDTPFDPVITRAALGQLDHLLFVVYIVRKITLREATMMITSDDVLRLK